jgi:hypothetical protein
MVRSARDSVLNGQFEEPGGVPKWLRERSAKPPFSGSNPLAASTFRAPKPTFSENCPSQCNPPANSNDKSFVQNRIALGCRLSRDAPGEDQWRHS